MSIPNHAVLLAFLCTSLPAQDRNPEHLLRLQFQKGQTTWLRVANDLTATMELGDAPRVQKIQITLFLKRTVDDVTSEGAKVRHEIYRMKTAGGEGDKDEEMYRYDSAHDDSAPAGASQITAMLGTSVVVTFDDRGRVQKLELPESLTQMNQMSGAEFMRMSDILLPGGPELPEVPVAVGARWSGASAQLDGRRNYTVKSSYELLSVEGRTARVRHQRTIELDDPKNDAEKKVGLAASRIFVIDMTRGRVIREETVSTIRPGEEDLMGRGATLISKRVVEDTDGKQDGTGEEGEKKPEPPSSKPTKAPGKD